MSTHGDEFEVYVVKWLAPLVLSACAGSLSVPPSSQKDLEWCEVGNMTNCEYAGAVAVKDPSYRASGIALLTRVCVKDWSRCESMASRLAAAGLSESLPALAKAGCPGAGEFRDVCEQRVLAFDDEAKMQAEMLAGGDWRPRVAKLCAQGNSSACSWKKSADAEAAERERKAAEESKRGEEGLRKQEEFNKKPIAERRKVYEAKCKQTYGEMYYCFLAKATAEGRDLRYPEDAKDEFDAWKKRRFDQLFGACISWYTRSANELVLPLLTASETACKQYNGLAKERRPEVVLSLFGPFGNLRVFSCGNEWVTQTTKRDAGVMVVDGRMDHYEQTLTFEGYRCSVDGAGLQLVRESLPKIIENYCIGTKGAVPSGRLPKVPPISCKSVAVTLQ